MSQAVNQIQRLVQAALHEFETLAASEEQPSKVLGGMLAAMCRATSAEGAVAWMHDKRHDAYMPTARAGQGSALAFAQDGGLLDPVIAAVTEAARQNKPIIAAPDQREFAGTELAPTTQFYVPMDAAGRVMGIVQIIYTAEVDPKSYRQYVAFTQQGARAAGMYLGRRQTQVLAEESASQAAMLAVVQQMVCLDKPHDQVHELANAARPVLESQRVAVVGYWCNKSEVAFSDVIELNRKAVLVRAAEMLADTARHRQVPMTFRKGEQLDDDDQSLAPLLDDLFGLGAAEAVCLTLIRCEDRIVGVMLAEYATADEAARHGSTQQSLCQHAGAILDRSITTYYRPLRRVGTLLAKIRDKPVSSAMIAAGIVAGVALVIYLTVFMQVALYVRADARLEPAHLMVLSAPQEGQVKNVLVKTGQPVHAGDVLVELDATEVNLKLTEVTKAIDAERVKLQTARAKNDVPEVLSSGLKIEQLLIRQKSLTREKDLTQVRSLIDGVVLTERPHQIEGMSVATGDALLHVADLSHFDLVMEVHEEDLALIEERLRDGTPVEASFLSRPWPDLIQHATIKDLSALAPTSGPDERGKQHIFKVIVPMELKGMSPQLVLANPTGRAKLDVGTSNLMYRYGRRVWRFLEMTLFF
ncbi:MAG: biotin/lipoyl-binding protein [Planctomycetes bacterium]|nr:biotin/lipoyl-binding protein [Planctomycetota bacterium]